MIPFIGHCGKATTRGKGNRSVLRRGWNSQGMDYQDAGRREIWRGNGAILYLGYGSSLKAF